MYTHQLKLIKIFGVLEILLFFSIPVPHAFHELWTRNAPKNKISENFLMSLFLKGIHALNYHSNKTTT